MQVRRLGEGAVLGVRAGGAEEEASARPGGGAPESAAPSEWELEQRSRGRAAYPTLVRPPSHL